MKATHRVYLDITTEPPTPAELRSRPGVGRPQMAVVLHQTTEITELYYDLDVWDCMERGGARWYRVTGAGDGYPYRVLIRAASRQATPDQQITIRHLAARMRLMGDSWYVDAGQIDLERARDLRNPIWPLTAPQFASLLIAICVLALELLVLGAGLHFGSHIPDIRDLSQGAAILIVSLLSLDLIVRTSRRMRSGASSS